VRMPTLRLPPLGAACTAPCADTEQSPAEYQVTRARERCTLLLPPPGVGEGLGLAVPPPPPPSPAPGSGVPFLTSALGACGGAHAACRRSAHAARGRQRHRQPVPPECKPVVGDWTRRAQLRVAAPQRGRARTR